MMRYLRTARDYRLASRYTRTGIPDIVARKIRYPWFTFGADTAMSRRGGDSIMIAVSPGDEKIYALDPSDLSLLWSYTVTSYQVVATGEELFFGHENSADNILEVHSLSYDGTFRWKIGLAPLDLSVDYLGLGLTDNMLLVAYDKLYAIDIDKGNIIWQLPSPGGINIDNKTIYVNGGVGICAVDTHGNILWRHSVDTPSYILEPVIDDKYVYVLGAGNNYIYKFDKNTGNLVDSKPVTPYSTRPYWCQLSICNNKLYVLYKYISNDIDYERLAQLDTNLNVQWDILIGSKPAIVYLFIGSMAFDINCISYVTYDLVKVTAVYPDGRVKWENTDIHPVNGPVIALSSSNKIYCAGNVAGRLDVYILSDGSVETGSGLQIFAYYLAVI